MHTIYVVSLGPGAPELLTLAADKQLHHAKKLVLRTARHGCVPYLQSEGITFTDFDTLDDTFEDFDSLNDAIAAQLWQMAETTPITYAVMDATCDASVARLMQTAPENAAVTVVPGISAAQACLAALPASLHNEREGIRTLPALALQKSVYDPRMPMLITEIDKAELAGDVKLWLSELYPEEMKIAFFAPSEKFPRKVQLIPLYEMDRQKKFDHTCCIYVPAVPLKERERFCFADLEEIMKLLRSPEGCPWDREQTHESLRTYLIEEAYEAVDAIDGGDDDRIADELGDVLLQVVFHGCIAAEHGAFTDLDITTAICSKMIRRHPHIFNDTVHHNAEEVSDNWEQLKKAEKHLDSLSAAMHDVAPGLPALMRAAKVQNKAKQVGFDWDDPVAALPKVTEEANEVLEELQNKRDPGEELGDLLFSCVNVVRLCGKQPELLLRAATEKFIRRFEAMENCIKKDGKSLEGLTLREMDVYWERVKALSGRS